MIRVDSNPATGQYSVDADGTYHFNSNDAGKQITITYNYAITSQNLDLYQNADWGYMQTYHPDRALNYKGVARMAGVVDLGTSGSVPNYGFEIYSNFQYGESIIDANPKDIVLDYLTNTGYGVLFPSGNIDTLSNYSNYCKSAGLFLSPALTEQKEAHEWLTEFVQCTNSELVWSQGKLKVIPYCDSEISANDTTFTPNITPLYDLTDDDFLPNGDEGPVVCNPKPRADCYNSVTIEYRNRDNDYNIETVTAKDQGLITQYGLRQKDPIKLHHINNTNVANIAATLIKNREAYPRNQYQFKLGFKYCLLEPMDILTITDVYLGLDRQPVRVISIEISGNLTCDVTVEELLIGSANMPLYATEAGDRTGLNYNESPGNINPPVIFEPPDVLVTSGLGFEVWIGLSSSNPVWGGAIAWISEDNLTYKQAGVIYGTSRQGILSADLASGSDPDNINTLSVDLTQSVGQLISGTQYDADNYNTLCYVDGELISYQTATLTATSKYDLTYLRRGVHGTSISSHTRGSNFLRLDDAVFKYGFDSSMIGKTIYLKFTSFNIWQAANQSLADVQAYTYQIKGSALNSPLPDVTNVISYYANNQTWIQWDKVSDFRSVDYEIRKGPSWITAQVLKRVADSSFSTIGDDTYWIAAHSNPVQGLNIYSENPASIIIAHSVIATNLFKTYDEAATNWSGTKTYSLIVTTRGLQLGGSNDILDAIDILAIDDILFYGDVVSSGTYSFPGDHNIDLLNAQKATLTANYTPEADSTVFDILAITDILAVDNILFYGSSYGQYGNIQLQIAIAQNDGVYGAWQNFVPGDYFGRLFKFQVVFNSYDVNTTMILQALMLYCYLDDRTDPIEITLNAAGSSVTYTTPFHALPKITSAIIGASAGDDLVITSPTVNGFSARVLNGGIGVSRTVDFHAKAY